MVSYSIYTIPILGLKIEVLHDFYLAGSTSGISAGIPSCVDTLKCNGDQDHTKDQRPKPDAHPGGASRE